MIMLPVRNEDTDTVDGRAKTWMETFWTCLDITKYVTSTLAAVFCCSVVFHGIALDENVAEFGGPIPESIIFVLAMLLLAANEGFQVGVLNSRSMTATLIRDEGYHRAANVHEVMFGTPGMLTLYRFLCIIIPDVSYCQIIYADVS